MSRYKRNVLSDGIATAVGQAAQLCLMVGIARWLPVEGFAGYLTVAALVGFTEMASDFGGRIWAVQRFALRASAHDVLVRSLKIKAFYSSIFAAIIFIIPWKTLNSTHLCLAVLIAVSQPSTDPFLWYLRGHERNDIDAALTLGWRLINASLLAVEAWVGLSLYVLLSTWLLSNLARIFIEMRLPYFSTLRATGELVAPMGRCEEIMVRRLLATVFPIGLSFVIMAGFQRLGVFVIEKIGTRSDVAIYGAAFTLVAASGFLATSVTVPAFPAMIRAVESNDWESLRKVMRRITVLIGVVFIPASIVGCILAPWIFYLLFPAEYQRGSLVMAWLLPGLYISSINFGLKYVLNAFRMNWVDALSVSVGALAYLATVMLPNWTELALGGAVAWSAGEFAIFAVKWATLARMKTVRTVSLAVATLWFMVLWIFALVFAEPAARMQSAWAG